MLCDIAVLTGGQVVTETVGLTLENAELGMLGRAHKVIVTKETAIVDGCGEPQRIAGRVTQIRAEIDAGSIQTTCVGALRQWAAGLIDDAGFRERRALGVDLAFAAAAGPTEIVSPRSSKPGGMMSITATTASR